METDKENKGGQQLPASTGETQTIQRQTTTTQGGDNHVPRKTELSIYVETANKRCHASKAPRPTAPSTAAVIAQHPCGNKMRLLPPVAMNSIQIFTKMSGQKHTHTKLPVFFLFLQVPENSVNTGETLRWKPC